jgi:hypothetical protein
MSTMIAQFLVHHEQPDGFRKQLDVVEKQPLVGCLLLPARLKIL